jgi:hypothetical protein
MGRRFMDLEARATQLATQRSREREQKAIKDREEDEERRRVAKELAREFVALARKYRAPSRQLYSEIPQPYRPGPPSRLIGEVWIVRPERSNYDGVLDYPIAVDSEGNAYLCEEVDPYGNKKVAPEHANSLVVRSGSAAGLAGGAFVRETWQAMIDEAAIKIVGP